MKNQPLLYFLSNHFLYNSIAISNLSSSTASSLQLSIQYSQGEDLHFTEVNWLRGEDQWGSSSQRDQSTKVSNLYGEWITLQGSFDIFFDIGIIVNFVGDEQFVSWKRKFILIGDLLTIFILHLFFELRHYLQRISYCLLIINNIEVRVTCVGSLQQEVVNIECFIVGPKVKCSQSDEWHEVAIAQGNSGIRIHDKLQILFFDIYLKIKRNGKSITYYQSRSQSKQHQSYYKYEPIRMQTIDQPIQLQIHKKDNHLRNRLVMYSVVGLQLSQIQRDFLHQVVQQIQVQQAQRRVYSHKRVQVVLDQMRLLTQSQNPYFIQTYYAFQDYESLYLVCEAIDSITFQNFVKGRSEFSEQQMRYIVLAIVSIFQEIHSKGYAFTEFSPKNLHFNRKTGELKLIEITNPAKIDNYCSSCAVSKVSPYSAPQILLRDKVYAECDFYSLGIIIYEMMILGPAFPLPKDKQTYQRSAIFKENIQVQKSQIPEKWHPDSADFLIKLLIKNPVLRLGRYGSFEVKNHPWLKQTSQEQNLKRVIDLKEWALQEQNGVAMEQQQYVGQKESSEIIQDYLFQQLFSAYKFTFGKQEVSAQKKVEQFSSKTWLIQKEQIEISSAS